MKKFKKIISAFMLLCLFLTTVQVTSYAYVLSYGGYYTSKYTMSNNMTTFSSYWDSSRNAWNNASSKVNITTASVTVGESRIIRDGIISDAFYGMTTILNNDIDILINANKCTTSTVKSVIVHELGHTLNLDDNNGILAYPSIMSNYRDRTVVRTPQTDDISGVNSSYNSSGIKY